MSKCVILIDVSHIFRLFIFPLLYSFGGKLHIGFVDIRNKLDSILKEREAKRLKRREEEEKVCAGMYSYCVPYVDYVTFTLP